MVDGLFEGEGTLYNPNDSRSRPIYQGQWRGGARNGMGHYIYPDQSEYDGGWLDNMKHGEGTLSSSEGTYKGQWRNGKRHGRGTMSLKNNGVRLMGEWENDSFVGGKVTYEDGTDYNGPIVNYKREGNGEYTYPDGTVYQGSWRDNRKEGEGVYRFSNGDSFSGSFRDGHRTGKYEWKELGFEILEGVYDNGGLMGGKIFDRATNKVMGSVNK